MAVSCLRLAVSNFAMFAKNIQARYVPLSENLIDVLALWSNGNGQYASVQKMWAILAGGFSVVSPPDSLRLAVCFCSFAALLAHLNRQAMQTNNLPDPLPSGQLTMKHFLCRRRTYFSLTTRQHFFELLSMKKCFN